MSIAKPVSDKDYNQRYDAETLTRAEEIQADKKRLSGAKKAAKVMATEKQKELNALNKVTKTKGAEKRTVKSPAKKGKLSKTTIKKAVKKVVSKRKK